MKRILATGCLFAVTTAFSQTSSPPSQYDNCPAAVRDMMATLASRYSLAGAQVAFAPVGRMTCAGAFGVADASTGRELTPTTIMRIGSISKVVTGMAIAKLLDDGQIDLDKPAVDFVTDLLPDPLPDPRFRAVTVRHLLHHSLGWDREEGGEPIQSSIAISRALGIRGPATSTDCSAGCFSRSCILRPARRTPTPVSPTPGLL